MGIKEKIAKYLEKIVPVLWSYVFGVGCGIIIYTYLNINFEKIRFFCLFFCILFFIIFTFLPKEKFTSKLLNKKLFLIVAAFLFGFFWYLDKTRITSPTHLLSFIGKDTQNKVIIRGTIVSDPDVRENFTNIIVKPDLIIFEPENYSIEIDTSLAKVIIEKEKVVRVVDGDTFVLKSNQKVRLAGIDAYEINTTLGKEAKNFLIKKILGKEVELIIQEDYPFDPYDRILAFVFLGDENINKTLIEKGLAKVYEDPNLKIVKKQKFKKEIKIKNKSGLIRSKVLSTIGDYYFEMNYGDYVEIISPIMLPKKATNPAGFDYRKYLNARGIYAVTKTLRNKEDIKYIGVGKLNPFVKFAYILRKRLLLTIKKTVPYPQSAFLGGVTLGYRGGIPQKIREQFQATGVAHVLALSGLHTGFIAALLLIICNIFRLKSFLRFILVSFALSIFVVMTGASAATTRSALMFCIGLFMYDVLKLSLRNSSRITIIIAASFILFFNPKLLPDASFVLSFMAVWSLIYVEPLIEKILFYTNSKIIHQFITFPVFSVVFGMTLLSFFGGIIQEVSLVKKIFPFLTKIPPLESLFPNWLNIENSSWLYKGEFFLVSLSFWLCGVLVYYLYSLSGKMLIKDIKKHPILRILIQFVCAQIAIQLGMMWPLSSVYFYRFPISGFYANFLAIPLIGVIVQLGWIAGIIDLFFSLFSYILKVQIFSKIGLNIALIINAFNNQLCQMFLGMAKTWGDFVPYPYVEMFSGKGLILWYLILCLVIWFNKLKDFVSKYKAKSFIIFSIFFGYFFYIFRD